VTACAVYTVHMKTRSVGFLVEPQNQIRRFVSGLEGKLMQFHPVTPQPLGSGGRYSWQPPRIID
jgi:hypothetical protein